MLAADDSGHDACDGARLDCLTRTLTHSHRQPHTHTRTAIPVSQWHAMAELNGIYTYAKREDAQASVVWPD